MIANLSFRRWALLLALCLPFVLLSACDDDDEPKPENEEEIIPEVRVRFFAQGVNPATASPAMTLQAIAGADGEISPSEITRIGSLARNSSYDYYVDFGDEELLEEIGDEEADEHRLFVLLPSAQASNFGSFPTVPAFTYTGNSYSVALPASDSDGSCPIGLEGAFTVPAGAPTGNLPVLTVLRHQPGAKSCASPNPNGNPNAGASDVEVLFQITIN